MAKTAEDKSRIAQEVIEWAASVTQEDGNTIITPHFEGKIIRSRFELYRLRKKLMKVEEYAFDTEFTSLRSRHEGEAELTGVSICWGKYNNYYVPVGHVVDPEDEQVSIEDFVRIMTPVFSRKDVRVIGHNLKAEMHILACYKIYIATKDLFDTLVAVWNIDENNEVGLKEVTFRYYGYNQRHFDDLLQTISSETKREFGLAPTAKGNASLIHIKNLAPYAMDDTFWTWQIYLDIYDALEEEGVLPYFYKRQMPYLHVLFNMERRGVAVDFDRLKEMERLAEIDLARLKYEILEIVGIEFNIGSDQQLAEILFGYMKKKPIYEKIREPIIDPKTGLQGIYKAGVNKGQLKWKEKNNKDKIIGYEECGNVELIANSYKFPIQTLTDSGAPATGGDALKALLKLEYKRDRRKIEGLKMLRKVLDYKRLEKLRSTYMTGLMQEVYADGKIHCSLNQTGTSSGRLSSSGPNLQNLPRALEAPYEPDEKKYKTREEYEKAYDKYEDALAEYEFWVRYEIRSVFIVDITAELSELTGEEEETIIAADYSNLEMRILTHFSQDPLLIAMFQKEADAHGDTAVNMFKLDCTPDEAKKLYPDKRQQAKTINFLLVYGGSPFALANSLEGVSKEEAQILYDIYFETYKGVESYIKGQKRFGHKNGHVFTVLGRKRHLDGINSSDFATKGYYERLAINAPIQGSAADIAISAQILIEDDEELAELGYRQVLQVHDEIVGIVPLVNKDAAAARVKYLMENCLPNPLDNVLLRVDWDYGACYAEAK